MKKVRIYVFICLGLKSAGFVFLNPKAINRVGTINDAIYRPTEFVYCLRISLLPAEYWALYIVHLRHTVHSKSSYFWNTLYCPVFYVTHTIDSLGKNYFKRAQFSNFCFLNRVENISNWKSWKWQHEKVFHMFSNCFTT